MRPSGPEYETAGYDPNDRTLFLLIQIILPIMDLLMNYFISFRENMVLLLQVNGWGYWNLNALYTAILFILLMCLKGIGVMIIK